MNPKRENSRSSTRSDGKLSMIAREMILNFYHELELEA
jgi:hypothetical protein